MNLENIEDLVLKWKPLNYLKTNHFNKKICKFRNGSRIHAFGVTANFRGAVSLVSRPNDVICDDIVPDNPTMSMDWYIDQFHSSIVPLLAIDGRVFLVGTPFTERDIVYDLRQNKKFVKLESPLLVNNKSTWESKFRTHRVLEMKKHMKAITWARNYALQPINPEGADWKKHWLGEFEEYPNDAAGMMYCFVDLAVSEKESADYAGITQVFHLRHRWYVVDSWAVRGIDAVAKILLKIEDDVSLIYIEAPGSLHIMCKRDPNFQDLETKILYKVSVKGNKIARLGLLEPYWKLQLILLRKNACLDLRKEFLSYPKGPLHCLDGLQAGVAKFGKRKKKKRKIYSGGIKRWTI